MALNLDISEEELASWAISEEEMAEILIAMDLIDEEIYRDYKETKAKMLKIGDTVKVVRIPEDTIKLIELMQATHLNTVIATLGECGEITKISNNEKRFPITVKFGNKEYCYSEEELELIENTKNIFKTN